MSDSSGEEDREKSPLDKEDDHEKTKIKPSRKERPALKPLPTKKSFHFKPSDTVQGTSSEDSELSDESDEESNDNVNIIVDDSQRHSIDIRPGNMIDIM